MTNFNEKIWNLLKIIPRGKLTTYKELARASGSIYAFRAVGNACNKNPYPDTVPCHRVVQSNGKLGGYALGLEKKKFLLRNEGIVFDKERIIDFDKYFFSFGDMNK